MVHIFEKTCKTESNIYGLKEIDDEFVLKNGPCVITILAGPISKQSINGSLRQVAKLINAEIDTNYDKDRRILGLGFGEYKEKYERFTRIDPTEEELNICMEKYFYHLISENNKKIDVLTAMKNLRNLTFVTYCNGAKAFVKIEKKLTEKMEELEYTNKEISMILSQIALAAVSGRIIQRKSTKALSITFGDVLDNEFERNPNIFEDNKEVNNNGFIQYNYNSIGFGIEGDGEHSFKKHMTENEILKETFLNTSLNNAIDNYYSNDIINPLTYEKVENAFNNSKKTGGNMEQIFNKLVRDNIPKIIENNNETAVTRILTDEEFRCELLKKLQEECDEVSAAKNTNELLEELADVLEILRALSNLENKSINDVIAIADEKKKKRGGFESKIFLQKTYKK